MSCLPAFIACLAYSGIGGLHGLLCRHFTETGGMPFPVAIIAVHLSAGSMVMKDALVTLWEGPIILFGGYWRDIDSSGVDCLNLLFLCGLLGRLDLSLVPKLSLIFFPFVCSRTGVIMRW